MRKPVRGTIASAISEARASLKDPSRPFTPAAMTRNRALFFEDPSGARGDNYPAAPNHERGLCGAMRRQGRF